MRVLFAVLSTVLIYLKGYPQPAVKEIRVNNEPYEMDRPGKIFLEPLDQRLMIELEPADEPGVRYAYRISDLDTHWTHSRYPVFNLYGLGGGSYTLEFKTWSEAGSSPVAKLGIEVTRAFWQKWWFWPSIVLYAMLVVGIAVYLFFLYDLRQKLKMQYVRNRIASDLHDEVGSNLNSIAIYAELLRKKSEGKPDILPILDRITSNSEETVGLMRDTVWAINPENDSTDRLTERMRSFGAEMMAAKNINFRFEAPVLKTELSMEQRRNLYLVYKEAVNNIVKHSGAKNAECVLEKNENGLRVWVADDGQGFDLSRSFEGNGLKNFSLRSRDNDLSVQVKSAPGEGTVVEIRLEAPV